MWTYDVDTYTWRDVDQGDPLPPPAASSGCEFLSYDRAADRIVLYSDRWTWLFDPRRDGRPLRDD